MASMGKSRVWGWRGGLGLHWGTGGTHSIFVGDFTSLGLLAETLAPGFQTLNPNFLPFSWASAIHPVP